MLQGTSSDGWKNAQPLQGAVSISTKKMVVACFGVVVVFARVVREKVGSSKAGPCLAVVV